MMRMMNDPDTCPADNAHLPLSASTDYCGCKWIGFEYAGNGGGIYLSGGDSVTLNLFNCLFENVRATGGSDWGGGLYVSGIKSVILSSSIFKNTSCAYHAGGGRIEGIKETTLVHNCYFDNSTSGSQSTGGICLENFKVNGGTNHSTYMTVFGCRFFNCTSTSSCIGGLYIYSPPSGVGIQDCMFQ
jgi:hypothetical protein